MWTGVALPIAMRNQRQRRISTSGRRCGFVAFGFPAGRNEGS